MAKKKASNRQRDDESTMQMSVPDGSCGGVECANPATVAIGNLRVCDDCLEKMRTHYPSSLERYWAHKIVPLVGMDHVDKRPANNEQTPLD